MKGLIAWFVGVFLLLSLAVMAQAPYQKKNFNERGPVEWHRP
jgi:hypothetical protein